MKRFGRGNRGLRNKQGGYLMFDLMLASAAAATLAIAAVPFATEQMHDKIAEVAVAQIYAIGEAAQTFRSNNGTWPDQASNCASAITAMTTAGFLAGISTTSAWGTTFTTSCNPATQFVITINAPASRLAQYAGSLVHTGVVSGNQITSNFPVAGAETAHDALLHRDAVAGKPQLNRMNTAIDMNNNNITNGGTIGATTVNATTANVSTANATTAVNVAGSSFGSDQNGSIELGGTNTTAGTGTPYIDYHFNGLTQNFNVRLINDASGQLTADTNSGIFKTTGDLQVVRNEVVGGLSNAQDYVSTVKGRSLQQSVQDAYIVSDSDLVPKPTCSAGLTPRVFTSVSQAANGDPAGTINQVVTYAENNGTTWRARMAIASGGSSAAFTPALYGRILVITKCD